MTTFSTRTRRAGFLLAAALIVSGTLGGLEAAAEPPVDPERQSTVFKRIFSYDKDLRESDKIVVLVVTESRDGEESRDVAAVFREKGMFPAVVTPAELNDDLTATLSPTSTVVYLTGGVDPSPVQGFAAAKGFLTISGQPTMAEAGHVSVSVDVEGERPEIVVNLARLASEGHELSAELLNLARVIR